MKRTLYWLQSGGCGGDSMALLNIEKPSLLELLELLEIEVLWHPSMSNLLASEEQTLLQEVLEGKRALDFFCLEGAVIRGPGGTGMYETRQGQPKKDLIAQLAGMARYVLAVGTCASFGGVTAAGEVEATGLQYHREQPGGFLGRSFASKGGLPVINLPGCPCHGEVVAGALSVLCQQETISLDEVQAPVCWYGMLVHQGCTRNEYYEYSVEERDFGERGCLFFHLGCQGPLTYGPCNKLLWNRCSSKTRVGVPCSGCTRPDFPTSHPCFQTRTIADIPLDLPEGVDRAHYLAYKGIAAAAAPERLKQRKTRL